MQVVYDNKETNFIPAEQGTLIYNLVDDMTTKKDIITVYYEHEKLISYYF
jgi:hypothetical protein